MVGWYVVAYPHLLRFLWIPIAASFSLTNAVKSELICSWEADGTILISPVVPSH